MMTVLLANRMSYNSCEKECHQPMSYRIGHLPQDLEYLHEEYD